jgi:DUF438 domain-containing protein
MTDAALLASFMDSLKDPFLFADTDHIVRYMNRAAIVHYEEGEALIGRSLLDCHNPESCRIIVETLAAMRADGLEERLITDNGKHRIFMRAVRDAQGTVLGYYERYEPPVKSPS